MNFLPFTDLRY